MTVAVMFMGPTTVGLYEWVLKLVLTRGRRRVAIVTC